MPALNRTALLAAIVCLLSGCAATGPAIRPEQKPLEIPVASVPRALREWNWGGGSCVHASNVMVLRRQNAMDLATYWRKTYSGGESYNGLTSKLNRNRVPFYSVAGGSNNDVARGQIRSEASDFIRFLSKHGGSYQTLRGDESVLERCTKDRRGGVIFYYPNHSIMFCGFTPDGKDAVVLDNNRIEKYIVIEKQKFLKEWRGYGGVCVVPTIGNPPPPTPYIVAGQSSNWSL